MTWWESDSWALEVRQQFALLVLDSFTYSTMKYEAFKNRECLR
jgi:hypothetical protein